MVREPGRMTDDTFGQRLIGFGRLFYEKKFLVTFLSMAIMAAVVIIWVPEFGNPIPCQRRFPNFARENLWMVGAYYYPWYGPDDRHWKDDKERINPFLGLGFAEEYNSQDQSVICRQIDLATGHGIDFFAVSWWGKGSFEDNTLKNYFIKSPLIGEISFALLYESEGLLGKQTILDDSAQSRLFADFEYMQENYWNHPSYLKINGKPVVFIYTTRGFQGNFDIIRALKSKFNVYLVADQYQWEVPMDEGLIRYVGYDAVTAYAFKPSPPDPNLFPNTHDYLVQFPIVLEARKQEAQRAGTDFIPDVLPAYYSPSLKRYLLNALSPNIYQDLIKQALHYSEPDIDNMIMLTSWNEWHEGTSIEPGQESLYKYLKALQHALALYYSDDDQDWVLSVRNLEMTSDGYIKVNLVHINAGVFPINLTCSSPTQGNGQDPAQGTRIYITLNDGTIIQPVKSYCTVGDTALVFPKQTLAEWLIFPQFGPDKMPFSIVWDVPEQSAWLMGGPSDAKIDNLVFP